MANNVRVSWNSVVKTFLDTTTDEWIFSVHNDVVLHPETLMRLLSWEKPLVSALIFMRQSPVLPHVWKAYDTPAQNYTMRINDTREWLMSHREYIQFGPVVMEPRPVDALTEIDFTSTSCTLMHRDVLEAMRKQVCDIWFRWDDDLNGGGEDRNFFEQAKIAGFQAYVDRSCIVGHQVGEIPTGAADFIAWDSVSQWKNTGEPMTERSLESERV